MTRQYEPSSDCIGDKLRKDRIMKKTISIVMILVLSLLYTDGVLGVTVLERRIAASSDDAEEALTAGYANWNYSSDLELVHDRIDNGGSQLVGMTFRDIKIAPGEVISNAYIEFVCDEVINGMLDAYFLIWGHLTDNSEGFIEPYLISDRPKTQARVPWEPEPWNAVGQKIQTVNIAPIIQELINQEGWVAGNALEIIIGEDPDKPAFNGVRCAESYDGSPPNAPLLHIEIDVPYATEPYPIDGDIHKDTWVSLMWTPGISAVSHDVYLGDNFDDVYNGAGNTFRGNQLFTFFSAGFPGFAYPDGLVRGTTYYWRIDEIEADGTVVTGDVWSFMIHPLTAYNPCPPDGSTYVTQDIQISWAAGLDAIIHTVYFGDNYDEVSNASGGSPQSVTTYTPGPLEIEKTYYWRVDEFDGVTTLKGDIWSFTTHPEIPITDPRLIGWWKFDQSRCSSVVDSSGHGNHGTFGGDPQWVAEGIMGGALDLNGDDYVAIDGVADDISSTNITLSAWIKTTQVSEGNVFAANSGSSHPLMFGLQDIGKLFVNDAGVDAYLGPAVNDDQWHMITYARSESTAFIYVDAVEVGTYTAGFSLEGVDRWSIGQEWDVAPSDFYIGMVDDVRIYDAALSADEIAGLAQ